MGGEDPPQGEKKTVRTNHGSNFTEKAQGLSSRLPFLIQTVEVMETFIFSPILCARVVVNVYSTNLHSS